MRALSSWMGTDQGRARVAPIVGPLVRFAVSVMLASVSTLALAGPIEDLQPGQWYEVPASKLSSVNPCPNNNCSYSGIEGQTGVLDDWNGGALATRYGAKGGYIVWGGGHAGYLGNEIYIFDVNLLSWARPTDPVVNPTCDQGEGELQNGSPCSAHTYDYLSYHPGTNSFIELVSTSNHNTGGGGSPRTHLFSFDTNQWRRGARKPSYSGDFATGASSAYDSTRDVFWLLTAYNQDFAKYDPNAGGGAGQWTEYQRFNIEIDAVAAIDPVHDLYVAVEGNYNHAVYVFDLKNPGSPGVRVTTAGDQTLQNTKSPGFEWDPNSQAFIGWAGGTSVYKLSVPSGDWRTATWQWSRLAPASSNTVTPTSPNSRGTYSRWQYVPAVNAFVVVNHVNDNVFFYKLNNAAPIVDPTVTFTADAVSLVSGGSTTLRWSATNATGCVAGNAWAGNKATSGTQAIGPLVTSATYSLTCTNAGGGSATRSVTVSIIPPAPTVAIAANPSAVAPGGSTTLSWTSTGATSCSGVGGDATWSGSKSLNSSAAVGPLNAATTYTLSCTNAGGTTSASVAVTLTGPPPPGDPVVTLSADATSVAANGATTLRWSTSNATACTASNGWTGSKGTAGTQATGAIAATTTYTLTCGNTGTTTTTASVVVTVVPPPTVGLTANPTSVASGAQSRLTWTSSNATACSATAGDASWTGAKTSNNNQLVGPIVATTIYTITCSGIGGSTSKSVTLTVAPPNVPTVTLNASPSTIDTGGSTDITWTTVNATSCTMSGGWSGAVAPSGTRRMTGLTSSQTYGLTCTSSSGLSTQQQVTVSVRSTPSATLLPSAGESGGGALGGWQMVLLVLLGMVTLPRRAIGAWLLNRGVSTKMRIGLALGLLCGTFGMVASAGVDATAITVVSTSNSAQTNVPVTFGQLFKVGEIPAGSTVGATKVGAGTVVPIQVDAKATHSDGSLRHAVITLKVPSLAANAIDQVMLSSEASGSSAGSAVTVAQLLATTFDAQIALDVGGTTYSASARALLQAGAQQVWLSGPLVSEWIVSGPVRTAGNSPHAHLTAYFHVRAYSNGAGGVGTVRVDCVVENGWSMVSGPGSFAYTPTITVGGAVVYTSGQLTHYHHTRWHKQFWWPTAPAAYSKLDTTYLRATKGIPNYGSMTYTSGYLSGLLQDATPMSNGNITRYMADTGAQPGIGPLPQWDSVYITSNADVRALRNALANSDSAGSYSVHFRDEAVGRPISIADHPTLTLQVDSQWPTISGVGNPNEADVAHQPSLGFLAYAVTGDFYYLEEMQFWTSWNQLWLNADANCRQGVKGIVCSQNRSQAWILRSLGQAAYITPDSHAYKAHLKASVDYNMVQFDSLYTNNAGANSLGIVASYDSYIKLSMWQDDFITWTAAYLNDLGFSSARPFRDWKFKFPVSRLGTGDYCFRNAATYQVRSGTSDSAFFPTIGAFHDANVTLGYLTSVSTCNPGDAIVDGYPAEKDGYIANLTPAAAAAVEAGYAGASAAWARLKGSSVQPDFNDSRNSGGNPSPVWNIVPRNDPGSSAPTLTLTASPTVVASGGSSTLNWNSTNATSCVASGGWSGAKNLTGSQPITNITQATSFALSCSGSGGPAAQQSVQVSISVPPPPVPTATLSASASSVQAGSPVTLNWSSTNATACTASNGWTGAKNASGSQQLTNLQQTATYTLVCSGAGGTSTPQSVQVTVTALPPPPAAIVSFTAMPASVVAGNSTTLAWSSTNAVSCTASGGWAGAKSPSSSQPITNLQQTATYTLVCTGTGGTSAPQSVQVTVTAAPPPAATVSLTATPSSVTAGNSVTLTWSTTNAASCTASGGWSGAKPTSGTQSQQITQTTSFMLSCLNSAGAATQQQVQVAVTTSPTTPTPTLPSSPSEGGGALTWQLLAALGLLGLLARHPLARKHAASLSK